MKLYGAETGRTFRPVWVAEELGLDYEVDPIGPRTGETKTAEYTAMTRKQKVPFLVDGDVRISESLAICRYLLAAYPGGDVWRPETLKERAKEDEWCCYIYGEIDETSLYVMRRHGDLAAIYGEAPSAMAAAKAYAERHLEIVAHYLKQSASVMPGGFGLADVMLMSCLDWAIHYKVDVPAGLNGYMDSMRARPAYQRARASNYKKLLGG